SAQYLYFDVRRVDDLPNYYGLHEVGVSCPGLGFGSLVRLCRAWAWMMRKLSDYWMRDSSGEPMIPRG
ncbi:MAG: hypothetical protein ACRENM_08350, partial [Candidatus Dormibacteraceae bacterium]